MSELKIRVYRGDEDHLATTVTIPAQIVKIAASLVPRRAVTALREQGVELDEIVRLSENPDARGQRRLSKIMTKTKKSSSR